MRVRKSHIEAFIRCPHLYELLYLKKLPGKPSVEMKIGSTFHRFAKEFFDLIDYNKLGNLHSPIEVGHYFNEFMNDVPSLAKPLCENFIKFEMKRLFTLRQRYNNPQHYFKPVVTELEYEAKDIVPGVDGFGHVDRIDYSSKDTLVVVEYKTSKRLYIPSLKRELTWYVLSLEKSRLFDRPFTHIACYDPRINEHFVARVTKQLKQVVRRRVLQLSRAYQSNLFPRRESMLCRWCPVLSDCIKEQGFMEVV